MYSVSFADFSDFFFFLLFVSTAEPIKSEQIPTRQWSCTDITEGIIRPTEPLLMVKMHEKERTQPGFKAQSDFVGQSLKKKISQISFNL